MELKHQYCYFENALDKDKVQEIIDICSEMPLENGEVCDTDNPLNKKTRDCQVSFIDDERIYQTLTPFINTANISSDWNFSIICHEPCQYTIYNKSQFYGYHSDCLKEPYHNHHNPHYNGMLRKLSMTLQLTDPSEYDGGDFYFKYLEDNEVIEEKVDKAKGLGTMIIFPSFVKHQVTPVTRGTRKSLVCWTLGYPFT